MLHLIISRAQRFRKVRRYCFKQSGALLLSLLVEISLGLAVLSLFVHQTSFLVKLNKNLTSLKERAQLRSGVNEIAKVLIENSDKNRVYKSYRILSNREFKTLVPTFRRPIDGQALVTGRIDISEATRVNEIIARSNEDLTVEICNPNFKKDQRTILLMLPHLAIEMTVKTRTKNIQKTPSNCETLVLGQSLNLLTENRLEDLSPQISNSSLLLLPVKTHIFLVSKEILRLLQISDKIIENQPLLTGVKGLEVSPREDVKSNYKIITVKLLTAETFATAKVPLRSADFKPLMIFTYLFNNA